MKRINNHHQLSSNNKLLVNSIRLQLNKSEQAIHNRRKLKSLPDQRNVIFKPKRSKKSLFILEQNDSLVRHRQYSLPFRLNRVQSVKSELKKLKSKIQQIKLLKNTQQPTQGSYSTEQMIRFTPSIFWKDFHSETDQKNKQKKKSGNILKFKVLISLNKKKQLMPQEFEEGFTLEPLKIPIDLPRIKKRQSSIVNSSNKMKIVTPDLSAEHSIITNKANKKKDKKIKFTDGSPWSTKGQTLSPLEVALQ